jgi:cytochrome b involved in lipid metabolism
MNYKTLLLGTGLIIVAVYSVYATVTSILEPDNAESVLTDSAQIEYSTTTDLGVENQSTNLGDVKSNVVNQVEASPEGVIVNSQTSTATSAPAEVAVVPKPAVSPAPQSIPEAVMARSYTLAEVARHSTEKDCWTAVNGMVYDLTSFIAKHPGGKSNIMRICGIDGTSVFERQHGGQGSPENTLAGLEIGVLK